MRKKRKTSFSLSFEAIRLLTKKARALGLSKTAALELFIRKFE